MRTHGWIFIFFIGALTGSCNHEPKQQSVDSQDNNKLVIYQVFTRLFGNTNTTNKPWGTVEENGVGKFNDFTDKALEEIRELGVTHIWYTGVLHHAMVTDYKDFGLPGDDPDVVKGRAGSPYSVKDYYNVNPDLAVDPASRLEEFEALVERTHRHGMKVIIDIVPNHVARSYHSVSGPAGVEDFGASDDKSREYRKDNNFYYIPGEPFRVPEWRDGYLPLGGEPHPLADGHFREDPAKWTGNGARTPQPDMNDWYEAVKINFGVRPDGTEDFDQLPAGFEDEPVEAHARFWEGKDVPDSWEKFREVVLYWLDKGVDGFRYDMAQMVPVEFWSYLNSAIKMKKPDAILVSEIYIPEIYREYIHVGKMDYLYDKVQLYDTLKLIMQGQGSTDQIAVIQDELADIEHHMLHFLENHDEQRIASPAFAGDARKGMPAMVVSSTLSTSPTMIYFGQEVGEPADADAGFGSATRTTIFDYWGVPHHARWVNNGAYDGSGLTTEELKLREFYRNLLNFTLRSVALSGSYREIHRHNRTSTDWYNDRVYSFVRWKDHERLVIVVNFDASDRFGFDLELPEEIIMTWKLAEGTYTLRDQLSDHMVQLHVTGTSGRVRIDLDPLESLILALEH
jgi:glycosidase